jgi:1,2-diacylglycerol 3-alpha-glucosyltransferase
MKIVHCCVSCFYIDGFAYQENQLAAQHVKDGHEVTIIASTEAFNAQGQLTYIDPTDYFGTDGARVIRIPYRRFIPRKLAPKIRAYAGMLALLGVLQPDIIVFHGLCAWELRTVARYVADHPGVRLFADCHEDFYNSASTFVSRHLLHKGLYRPVLRSALRHIEEVLCVTVESLQFATGFYGVPEHQARLFPLGGHVHSDADYAQRRQRLRTAHGLSNLDTVIVQSGKITASKFLPQALAAFSQTQEKHLRFWIVGQILDHKEACEAMIQADRRIEYLGWKSPAELEDLLCAADVYLQPRGQTATTQMSMCCRCATIVEDVPSHRALFADSGFLLNEQTSMLAAFQFIAINSEELSEMKQRAFEFAKAQLDYVRLARQICAPTLQSQESIG